MSRYKEDLIEAKDRLSAWWDHELIDRPCLSYWYFREDQKYTVQEVREVLDPWYLAQHWDDFETCLDAFERTSAKICYGKESIPRFFPNYGPGIMAAIFGIEPIYKAGTVWFNRPTPLDEIVDLLESVPINGNNPWYSRLIKISELSAKRGGTDFCVAMTDIGGVLDILSSFLGPEQLIMTMKRQPPLIDTCRAIILEKTMKVYAALQTVIEKYSDGCSSWMNIWCPKRWYPLQCDFSYMLSPKWFERFVLPDLITQAESLDYAIYHLDGPNQLKYLDTLLKIPTIHGIQWVPGAQSAPKCSTDWMPVYKKIQTVGKNVVIDFFENSKFLPHFYSELDPKGLLITLIAADFAQLQFHLPTIFGGQGGVGNYKEFRRELRKKLREERK